MTQRRQNWAIVEDGQGNPVEVEFLEWRCNVVMERYADGGGLSLRLVDAQDNSSIARATANLRDQELRDDEVLIKDYSENAGVLEAFVAAELMIDTGRTVRSEHATLNTAGLTPLLAQQWHTFRDQLESQKGHERW